MAMTPAQPSAGRYSAKVHSASNSIAAAKASRAAP
jgi:hypothetical protein